MIKPKDPKELAETILNRSICSVQVGCAISDNWGIHSWGWNSAGAGYGLHAEVHAIKRASWNRLEGSTLYVASRRARNSKAIPSRPCEDCMKWIIKSKILDIWWRDLGGGWIHETLGN